MRTLDDIVDTGKRIQKMIDEDLDVALNTLSDLKKASKELQITMEQSVENLSDGFKDLIEIEKWNLSRNIEQVDIALDKINRFTDFIKCGIESTRKIHENFLNKD